MTAKPNLTLISPPRPLPADHVERNPGIPLDLDVVRAIRVNRSAVERRAATMGTRRTVKKEWQAAWLLRAGQRLVQVLPTQELSDGETSPYGALSAFAIDPIYIAIEKVPDLDADAIASALGDEGRTELARVRGAARVDYKTVRPLKRRVLGEAFDRFRTKELAKSKARARAFFAFVEREASDGGINYFVSAMAFGDLPSDATIRSAELFARHVIEPLAGNP